ncbi:MAG: hypothetical protein IT160_17505 [Bryobacterales bacterium]|nr:hypothetical protein [Bryobacterales bacterium]
MTPTRILVLFSIAVFTLIGYFYFPGHTYLQQDSLIYVPMFEHLSDPTVLKNDIVSTRPHLAFTIYDEVTIGASRLTGLSFETVLAGQQILFRFLGLLGVYLAAASLGLARRPALLVTGIFALGATIGGPSVLTFEYEPIPRGFALMLVWLAIGCAASGRDTAAGIFASVGFLYHPPTVFPFWGIYFLLTLWPSKPEVMLRRIRGLAPLAVAVVALLLLSRLQAGVSERQSFFGIISPWLEQLQRMRGPYNWVGIWFGQYALHYIVLGAVAFGAVWRIRHFANQDLRFFLFGLPAVGLLSLPVSYLLLDILKWNLMSQFQPARAVLFVTATAVFASAAAAMVAASEGRPRECYLWALASFVPPISSQLTEFVRLGPADPALRARLLLLLTLAALATLAGWAESRFRRLATAPWLAASLAGFLLIPTWGQVRNYPNYHSPELNQLARWGATHTPKDAIFLFPDAGRYPSPGIFRVLARRAIFVDWKGGGQVNFLHSFGEVWWDRWKKTTGRKLDRKTLADFRAMGIDYVVVKPEHRIGGIEPVYQNSQYIVYQLSAIPENPTLPHG